jgi:hypothetical protein
MNALERLLKNPSFADGLRRDGRGGYMAPCPAHRDDNASLHITPTNGRVLLYCFAGCRFDRIVRSLNLRPSDLFDRPLGTWSRR